MAFNKPCLVCGTLSRGSRCPTHQTAYDKQRQADKDADPVRRQKKKTLYNPAYQKQAKVIRDTATICHLCGKPAIYGDPWQADHIDAGNPDSPLAAAHRSCNARRGNKKL